MITTFLTRVERFRLLAMLLLTLCAYSTANAQGATSDEINAAIVTHSDVELTWTNDAEHPWVIGTPSTGTEVKTPVIRDDMAFTSVLKFSYSSDKETIIYFDRYRSFIQEGDKLQLIIDGKEVDIISKNGSWQRSIHVVSDAGFHVVELVSTSVSDEFYSGNCSAIKNICVKETELYEVTVDTPGQFVSNLVDMIGDKSVMDVYLIKLSGYLNGSDWEGLSRLSGLVAIDMTDLENSVIPDGAFIGLSNLCNVQFPKNVINIGISAFQGLSLLDQITLPKSLEEIGKYAFYNTGLKEIMIPANIERIEEGTFSNCGNLKNIFFAEGSKLKYIGLQAFRETILEEFIMPDGVEEIYVGPTQKTPFDGCSQLRYVKISKSLKEIPRYLFYYSSNLTLVEIPEGVQTIADHSFATCKIESLLLPESLKSIGASAFQNTLIQSIVIPKNVTSIGNNAFGSCRNLKSVTLNSNINNLNGTFSGCDSIHTIIVPTVTPPSVIADPFSSVDRDLVTVLVPDFAIKSFKIDPYWFLFRNIRSSVEISTSDFWAIHGNLRLNSSYTISGTPSIDIEAGGILDIDEGTPLSLNDVTYNVQEDVPACFLNESNQVTANSLLTKFYLAEANKWYFFSPVTEIRMADVSYPATDSWVIYHYDGNRRASENSASGNWAKMTVSDVLKRGQGYIIQAAAAGTLHLPAAASELPSFFGLGEASMSIDDNVCESAENAGWNLVGNPYPAYYDIYSIELQAPITVWDGSTYRAYSLTDDNYVLRPMQPFFVQKSSSDITFAMPRGGRQGSNEVIRPHAQQVNAVDANRHKINLEITRGDNESADDYTRIVINEEASLAYEGKCDASKFMSMDGNVAQVYSLGMNSHPLAINERPYADGNAVLGVYIPAAGETYRISAVRADRKAWLYDDEAKIEQDLTEGDYFFTATKSGEDNSRFSIRFAPSSITAVAEMADTDVKVTGNEGSISVVAAKGTSVVVYGADGVLISSAAVGDGTLEFEVDGGVYIVKANGQSFKTIVK